MAATASACILTGSSPAGKSTASVSVGPAQTQEFSLTPPVQVIALNFPCY